MEKAPVYIGIDPGAKGYFCLLNPANKQVGFFSNTELPEYLFKWLKNIQIQFNPIIAMIEDVHAIYGSSAGSNFKFGYNVGIVNTIPLVAGISVDRVTPKKWQKFIGVRAKGKEIKKNVASICERLYPSVPIRGLRGGLQDGKSDSLMIAHYAAYRYKI